MLKRILFMMITLFTLTAVNAGADEYDYTLFQEDESGELVAIDGDPYSCNTIYDLVAGGAKDVTLMPVFGCAFGYEPEDPDNIYGECKLKNITCFPGYYLYTDENADVFQCKPCPVGFYCPGGESNVLSENKGIVKCPQGTTTTGYVSTGSALGQNASIVEQCSWHICQPGQQLKVENGVASCKPCDKNHYCVGGIYDIEHADASMQQCPTKTYAGAGTSEEGAFRCSYACPAGKAMLVVQDWYRHDTDCVPCPEGVYCPGDKTKPEPYLKDYFMPTVYIDGISDVKEYAVEGSTYYGTESCPAGKKTLGIENKDDTYCTDMHFCVSGQYWNGKECKECSDGYNVLPIYNKEDCNNMTKNGLEWKDGMCYIKSTSVTVDIDASECDDLSGITVKWSDNKCKSAMYCPGGNLPEIKDDNGISVKMGMYQCQQYLVVSDVKNEIIFDPQDPDLESEYNSVSLPDAGNSGCTCPKGYSWRKDSQTCCLSGGLCCPRGKEIYSFANGNSVCQTCSSKAIDGIDNELIVSGGHYYCPGTVIEEHCTPVGDQYYNRIKETCVSCGAGSEPVGDSPTGCVCTRELLGNVYPNEPHGENDTLVRAWNADTNSCEYLGYQVGVYYTDIRNDGSLHYHGTGAANSSYYWLNKYNYSDNSFVIQHTPSEYGYVFIGWCRDKITCSGEDLIAPGTTITIDPKSAKDRLQQITYYAQMRQVSFHCDEGYYLDVDNIGKAGQCKKCEVGHWCPGGNDLSVTNIGQNACERGKYNEYTGKSQESDCLSCSDLYGGHWSLTTEKEATDTAAKCGYYCEPGKYAAEGTWVCNQTCTADTSNGSVKASYCPGGGYNNDTSGWVSKFYTDAGKGRYHCPEGLTADDGGRDCYKTCEPTYYAKKDLDGEYKCVLCDGNIPEENSYYYCPGGKIIFSVLSSNITSYVNAGGKINCLDYALDGCHGPRASSVEPASECYCGYEPGKFMTNFGTVGECMQNAYCPGGTIHGVLQCPLGSVSHPGAGSVFDCECLSDKDLQQGESSQYRPKGVYTEKGAGLYKVANNEYVCANTYLVVDDPISYENPGTNGEIPTAGARVVACQWNGTQTEGSYDNCTEKAMRVCDKNKWIDLASSSVSTTEALKELAEAFEEPLSLGMFKGSVSSVKSIQLVGDECNNFVCPEAYFHYDSNEGYCYATIDYDLDGGVLVAENSNPSRYVDDDLPIVLNNPEKAHHVFYGWCLADETDDACEVNNGYVVNEATGDIITFGQRTIPEGASGDLKFVAKWQMVCPYGYANHDDKLTEITQCYAKVEFDSNKNGLSNPESHIEQYSEGASTYTLATLPALSLTGYKFGGWYDNSATNGRAVTSETELLGDYKLYAKWSPITYTVVFDGNGASGEMASESFKYDERKPLTVNNFAKTGYVFDGWCDALNNETGVCADNANSYSDGESVSNLTTSNNAEITMYAKWSPITYTVMFDGNGAVGSMEPETFDYDEHKALFANEFTKIDYVFVGWCKGSTVCSSTDSNFYTNEEEVFNLTTVEDAEIIMYAQWQAIGCSAEFPIKDSATGYCYADIVYNNITGAKWLNSHNQIITENPDPRHYNATTLPITLSKPRKDNYKFSGWCDNEDLTENCLTEKTIPIGSTGHKTFWAKWEPACDSGKYLHIGDKAICLYPVKPTSPALAIKLGNTPYYAHMCTDCSKTMNGATGSKLHIRYNNKTYNVYDLTAQ